MEIKCNNTGSDIWMSYKLKEASRLKKLIRQYRLSQKHKPLLCHMLINLRTWGSPVHVNRHLCHVLTDKSKHREYWIKEQVLVAYGGACLKQNFTCEKTGNRTYFVDGKYYDYDIEKWQHLPF